MVFNGIGWTILLVSPNHPELKINKFSYTLGCCVGETHTIYVNEYIEKDKFKKVLCHELTHAAMISYGVNLTPNEEELLADLMSTYGQEIVYKTNKLFYRLQKIKGN